MLSRAQNFVFLSFLSFIALARCSPVTFDIIDSIESTDSENGNFIKCMAKCLGHSIADIEKWEQECHTDVKCWEKKVGFKAIVCVAECAFGNIDSHYVSDIVLPSPGGANGFVECLAKCLGHAIGDIIKWEQECHKNVKCWVKKVGFKALKCVPKCIKLEQQEVENIDWNAIQSALTTASRDWLAIQSALTKTPSTNVKTPEFVKCWARCLGRSIAEVEQWATECHTDVKCWIEKAGLDAVVCAGKCIGTQEPDAVGRASDWSPDLKAEYL